MARNNDLRDEIVAWNTELAAIGAGLSFPVGLRVSDYDLTAKEPHDQTGALIYAIYAKISTLRNAGLTKMTDNPGELTYRVATPTTTEPARTTDYTDANMHTMASDDTRYFFQTIISLYGTAPGVIINLVAANQIKRLKNSVIGNYFASKGGRGFDTRRISDCIDRITGVLPMIMSNDDLRAKVEETDWVKYHTSASSTAMLCTKAANITGGIFNGIFSAESTTLITEALAAPWNKALADRIPKKVLIWTYYILNAYNVLPNGWVQGTKALDHMVVHDRDVIKNFCDQLAKITKTTVDFKDCRTIEELIGKVPRGLLDSVPNGEGDNAIDRELIIVNPTPPSGVQHAIMNQATRIMHIGNMFGGANN